MKNILKFATLFYLYSFADYRSNMILRIMHSMIPTLVGHSGSKEEQERLAVDLLIGAKKIFELGAKAISSEYDYVSDANNKLAVKKCNKGRSI